MECDNTVKKLFFIFINVIIISLFAALPVSASENNNFSNAVFTGSNFNWHSGPALSPAPHEEGFNHYLIIYRCASTWGNGDSDYVDFYSINDSITSINLNIENGGCSLIYTSPVDISPYSAYLRYVSYDFSDTSESGYVKYWDSEMPVPRIYLDFDSPENTRLAILTDLPCFDQNGNPVGNIDTLPHFYFKYFMDGSGKWHHLLSTSATSLLNDISVTWYVVNGTVNTPSNIVYDTFSTNVLTDEYVTTNMQGFDYFKEAYHEYLTVTGGVLGQFFVDNHLGALSFLDKAYEYYYTPVTSVNIERAPPSFDIYDYYPFIHLKADTLTTTNKSSFCQLDMGKWRKNLNLGGIYDYNHVAIIAVVSDGRTTKLFRHDFNVSDCFATMDSNINNGNISQKETSVPSEVSDFQTLADYLKNVFDNMNYNNAINNANLVNNLTSFPWANAVNAGVGGALSDFLPNLSSEFDSIFTGLFNDFTVPSQDQIDDIQREIQAEQDDLHNKLAFVDDVKTEIYFVSSSISAAGSSEPHFKQKFVYYVPAYNVQTNSYYLSLEQTSEEVTFFRGSWIDVNTREILKDLVTVFASLAVLLHIWHTLPSTVGNMPVSRGGE